MTTQKEKRGIWARLFERKSPEESRVASEAKQLAALLLKIPRRKNSVLHELTKPLTDGMQVGAVLCNTAKAKTLQQLLAAKHGADRVDVYTTGARYPQANYSLSFKFQSGTLTEFSEYAGDVKILGVSNYGQGYVARRDYKEVPFDVQLQKQVFSQTAEIFSKARAALQ